MTRIIWGQSGVDRYESGVDHGVLYLTGVPGEVWNGLISVTETSVGGDQSEYFLDGVKTFNHVENKDYRATVEAYSSPVGFRRCLGRVSVVAGLYLTRQQKERFGFTYRTRLGPNAYKIHVVYNCAVSPGSRNYASLSESPDPTALTWIFDAVPPKVGTHRPTAHFVIDSTKATASDLQSLENMLYGTDTTDPYLPDAATLVNLFDN